MNYEIIFVVPGSSETWKHKPGRLWLPLPRNSNEAAEAVREILNAHPESRLTIVPVDEHKKP